MGERSVAAVILAAGMGTRMKSSLPKVMHRVAGKPMVCHVADTVSSLNLDRTVVVIGPDMEMVRDAVAPHVTAIQHDRLGTADAVKAARGGLAGFEKGTVLVLFGDTPLIEADTLGAMVEERESGAAVVALGFRPEDPEGYGRLFLDEQGNLERIVEHKDATDEERLNDLCNSGVMAVDASILFELVDAVGNDNAKGEYYLTDIVALARGKGRICRVIEADEEELMGVNSRLDLAEAEAIWQARKRFDVLSSGVTLLDPATVWFSHDTQIAPDVIVGQNVVFGPGVIVEAGATVHPFCHVEGAHIGPGAAVGPFARLRPGAELGEKAKVGNFVEIKKAELGKGAKVNHLTYIGDASIGPEANIGAGTITCNYDGYLKHRTVIGEGAFIGSNTALVAPVEIGKGAMVGAGSTISKDVPDDAIALTRADQRTLKGAARSFRERRRKLKEGKA